MIIPLLFLLPFELSNGQFRETSSDISYCTCSEVAGVHLLASSISCNPTYGVHP